MKLSPFGMTECCICDAPATHAIPTETEEFLPYCHEHAVEIKREFPRSRVFLLSSTPEEVQL